MANEKVSGRQGNAIVAASNEKMTLIKSKVEDAIADFAEEVSHIWEDQNAVDYAKKLKASVEDCINELSDNNGIFHDAIAGIVLMYAKQGGMSDRVTTPAQKLSGRVDVSKIQKYFADSENEDDFGFKNVDSGADQVMAALDQLKSNLEKIKTDAINDISKIPAFGNEKVRANVGKSIGTVVSILGNHILEINKLTKDYVDKTAQGYKKVGAKAEEASDLRETK